MMHSSDPWTAGDFGGDQITIRGGEGQQELIAVLSQTNNHPNAWANARLMIAAPKMRQEMWCFEVAMAHLNSTDAMVEAERHATVCRTILTHTDKELKMRLHHEGGKLGRWRMCGSDCNEEHLQ